MSPARAANDRHGDASCEDCLSHAWLCCLRALRLPRRSPMRAPGVPPGMASRLSAERVGAVEPGLYSAGDDGSFTLQPYGSGKYLLRFSGAGESFVLTVERGSLGAKLLKYDTGTTALRVSVWGGLTLYTQDAPQGMPATYQGAAPRRRRAGGLGHRTADRLQRRGQPSHLCPEHRAEILRRSGGAGGRSGNPRPRLRRPDQRRDGDRALPGRHAAARPLLAKRINSVKVAEGGKPTIASRARPCWSALCRAKAMKAMPRRWPSSRNWASCWRSRRRDIATK